jgi:hypothetical protein
MGRLSTGPTLSWFMVAVVGLSPMLVYFIVDVVGWVLRRKPGCNQKTALEPGTSKDESPLCLPGEVDRVAIIPGYNRAAEGMDLSEDAAIGLAAATA